MQNRFLSRILQIAVIGFGLSACDDINDKFSTLDVDLRNNAGGLDTSSAARLATVNRPKPDDRGVISYPNYQVAVARRGDTVTSIANRLGLDAAQIARFNGMTPNDKFNGGEIIALPESAPLALAPANADVLDISQIATSAIDRSPTSEFEQATPSKQIDGPEPIRHRVKYGETAPSIAELYNVSVRSLADWNGLGSDLAVRLDQYLLIPITKQAVKVAAAAPKIQAPIQNPEPVAEPETVAESKPVPTVEEPAPKPIARVQKPSVPTISDTSKFLRPVSGEILRPYKASSNEGIDIAAAAGTPIKSAADGIVAAITRNTGQESIIIVRHAGDVLTVYANVTDISVKRGDEVMRGQILAKVAKGSPAFLHFEVREGAKSVDPVKYLN